MRAFSPLIAVAGAALAACTSGEIGGVFGEGGADSTGMGGAAGTSVSSSGGASSTSVATSAASTGATASASSGVASASASSGAASTSASSASGGMVDACSLWKTARADMSEGAWSGSLASCKAGDVAEPGRTHALAMVNLYRALAGLPEVDLDPSRNEAAQACALMMHANNQLSHFPPANWKCFTELGAGAAGKSNIATTPGVEAVDLYMIDPGNATTIGHRRWILSNGLGPIGVGSTSGFSCMWVLGGNGNAQKEFVAWPPAGQVPIQAWTVTFESLDSTGWTIQSDSVKLTGGKVTVMDGGKDMPVDTVDLLPNYGSSSALRFNPKGWKAMAGHTYDVTVTGASKPVAYSVEVVDCP